MKVAVIQAGPSAEAQVSRKSAAGVVAALKKGGHEVHLVELNAELGRSLEQVQCDVVFPVVHGHMGEDGRLQGFLEVLGVPYVGSSVLACALASDKIRAKQVFRAHGLPVVNEIAVTSSDDLNAAASRVIAQFGAGVAVKPTSQGSAIGISLVHDVSEPDAVLQAFRYGFEFDDVLLCERFVRGKEVTCGVIDGPSFGGLRAFSVTEIFSKAAAWYDFQSRYATGGSVHECPANLPDAVSRRVQQVATQAFLALGCRDLCRVDFVVGDGDDVDAVTLLEVNTIPGMTATSLYPEAAAASGIEFVQLCDGFVRQAYERGGKVRQINPLEFPA